MSTKSFALVLLASLATACGSGVQQASQGLSDEKSAGSGGFTQPAGTVAVSFAVDDRENRVYEAGDLKWKGSFIYDATTRILTFDPFWSAGLDGWPTLYDDGPWTQGGHEPIGARAKDHVWGVTVFVHPPAAGSDSYQYGLTDALYENKLGNGWMWMGNNGEFTVSAGGSGPITATGMSFARFGHVDLEFTLDTNLLAQVPSWTWDTTTVTVKSSTWGWGELAMASTGGGLYTLRLSDFTGKHALLVHTGLLNVGEKPEFVFTLGGVEYRNWWVDYRVFADGVTVESRGPGAPKWTPAPIWWADDLNTAITVPEKHPDQR
ncbi:MAG TPA: hypothetical protein VMT45_10340 [Thermoanaerobaculaceae bacterium]|nr:hypothetical protein [Thermoanaerobaculaceae bacterium]